MGRWFPDLNRPVSCSVLLASETYSQSVEVAAVPNVDGTGSCYHHCTDGVSCESFAEKRTSVLVYAKRDVAGVDVSSFDQTWHVCHHVVRTSQRFPSSCRPVATPSSSENELTSPILRSSVEIALYLQVSVVSVLSDHLNMWLIVTVRCVPDRSVPLAWTSLLPTNNNQSDKRFYSKENTTKSSRDIENTWKRAR